MRPSETAYEISRLSALWIAETRENERLVAALLDIREYVQTAPFMLESEIIGRIDSALRSRT